VNGVRSTPDPDCTVVALGSFIRHVRDVVFAYASAGTSNRGRSTMKTHTWIRGSLLERPEQGVAVSAREPTTFILDFDQHAIAAGADPQRDGRMRPGELERILQ
jgi:hypothetical protein